MEDVRVVFTGNAATLPKRLYVNASIIHPKTQTVTDVLKAKIKKEAEAKLREAKARYEGGEDGEIEQQKREDRKTKSFSFEAHDAMAEWDILSVRVSQDIEIKESGCWR